MRKHLSLRYQDEAGAVVSVDLPVDAIDPTLTLDQAARRFVIPALGALRNRLLEPRDDHKLITYG